MGRWARLVLRHRKAIVVIWGVVLIAGIALASKTTSRLTVDFSLPGQPGTETAHQIKQTFGSGGDTSPYIVTVTLPAGQTITGHEADVARTFDAVGTAVPNVRIIDEANTGDKALPHQGRSHRLRVRVLPVQPVADGQAADHRDPDARWRRRCRPAATVGVTGEEPLAAGSDDNSGPGVLGETMIGAVGALVVLAFVFASFLALLPLVVAAVSILTSFLLLLPLTYVTDVSFIVQFLIALIGLGVAIDYSLLFVTRWREERDHGRDNHDAVVVAMQTAGHAVVFSGVTVAIGLLALVVLPVPFMRSMGIGGALIPLASVLITLTLTPAILGGIGPADRLAEDPPREPGQPRLESLGRAASSGTGGSRPVTVAGCAVRADRCVPRRQDRPGVLGFAGPERPGVRHPADPRTRRHADRRAHPDGGAGLDRSGPVAAADQFGTDRRCPARARADRARPATATGAASCVLVPEKETVNSKSVGVVKRVEDAPRRPARCRRRRRHRRRRRSTSCTPSTATSR